jgi:hypothetical protein
MFPPLVMEQAVNADGVTLAARRSSGGAMSDTVQDKLRAANDAVAAAMSSPGANGDAAF